jgi:gluconate 2-dehydrogenase gamma chain
MKPSRRIILRTLAAAPMAAGFLWTEAEAQQAHHQAQAAQAETKKTAVPFRPKFFTRHEYATVTMLVDIIIPKDERSGSATDAGVPQFMDFMMTDQPARQTAMRGGLAWLDRECVSRFEKDFLTSTPQQRAQVLDDISWPHNARPEHAHGVAFFNSFRDLTASGFFTSKMGLEDLQYMGNRYVPEWTGCPSEVLKKLGLGGETA